MNEIVSPEHIKNTAYLSKEFNEHIDYLIDQAMQMNINLLITDEIMGNTVKLNIAQIERIRRHGMQAPVKITINTEDMKPNGFISLPKQDASIHDIKINKKMANKLLRKKIKSIKPEALNYTTRLLNFQNMAIKKFWIKFNPTLPPRSVDIVSWLIEQGLTQREASMIDCIIRPDAHKRGGIRSRKK